MASSLKRRLRPPSHDEAILREFGSQLASVPRYQPGEVRAGEWCLEYLDSVSLLSAFDVVVVKRWNDFHSEKLDPVILDCGANIGISVIHYKKLFPQARVTAFEPDPRAVKLLRRNLVTNGIHDVHVVEAALWTKNGRDSFFSEGADANRLVSESSDLSKLVALVPSSDECVVETVRLADYLSAEVDFVKLDIEGAETEVIVDCGRLLRNVRNLVVEFHLTNSRPRDLARMLQALADAGFHVAVSSYGPWVDLLHKTTESTNGKIEFDQYLLISAWRTGPVLRGS